MKKFLCLLLLLLPLFLFGKNFSVEQQTATYVDIAFSLPAYELTTVSEQGTEFERLKIDEEACAGWLMEKNKPLVPTFSTFVALPDKGNYEVSILKSTQKKVKLQNKIYPSNGVNLENESYRGSIPSNLYEDFSVYPQESVLASSPMVMRDYRVGNVTFAPVTYDRTTQELILTTQAVLRVRFIGGSGENELEHHHYLSKSFEPIYENTLINYNQVRNTRLSYQNRSALLIYGSSVDITAILDVFATWKREKGFEVRIASATETGTSNTSIKSYIQNAFDTWANPPEYIILVGDVSGTISVPTYATGGAGDVDYTFLAGNDLLPDAAIGRMSVESATELATGINKILAYEKTPNMGNAAMYAHALLVGDSADSGVSTYFTNYYIRDMILDYVNPNYTFTEMYSNDPNPSQMDVAINSGVNFFNYRGYAGMSEWSSTHINGLNNIDKVFNAVIITCDTGTFTGTSRTELLFRLGTSNTKKGAVSAIGMSTLSTHTAFNNILDGGIFQGFISYGKRDVGSALLNGKYSLWAAYGNSNPGSAENFSHWCNQIGDPTTDVWLDIPKTLTVTHPAAIAAGANSMNVHVTGENSLPQKEAWVNLLLGTTSYQGYTNAQGNVTLYFPANLSGTVKLTVSKPDYIPYQASLVASGLGNAVTVSNYMINDDNQGQSHGNGNSIIEAGESIEYTISLANNGTVAVSGVTATLTSESSSITINQASANYGTINAGQSVGGTFVFSLVNNSPDTEILPFVLNITANGGLSWEQRFSIPSANINLEFVSYTTSDSNNHKLDPGETVNFIPTLKNISGTAATNLNAVLRSLDSRIVVNDSTAAFNNILSQATGNCQSNPFNLTANAQLIPGMQLPLKLILTAGSYKQELIFNLAIGEPGVNDPLGPDQYGYFCYDVSDVAYPPHPSYEWIEIVPSLGGQGTNTNIHDGGDDQDQVETFNLPFSFRFYGRSYTEASISSNGVISFGETEQATFRNWRLPGALGPYPMIAVFWDDLVTTGGGIYSWYNQEMHYYVVTWDNVKNYYNNATETFQVILYDPAYYPTLNNDGQIKLQYKVFNNVDQGGGTSHGNYCTIGLEDHSGFVGLEYTYNNTYPTAAQVLGNETALYFTGSPAYSEEAYLYLGQPNVQGTVASNVVYNGSQARFTVNLSNIGNQSASNVQATLSSPSANVTVLNAQANYGTIASGAIGGGQTAFVAEISPYFTNGAFVPFHITTTAQNGTWEYDFSLVCYTPVLNVGEVTFNDASGNHVLEPGESGTINLQISNSGGNSTTGASVYLYTEDEFISFSNPTAEAGAIAVGESHTINNAFNFTVAANCPLGHSFSLHAILSDASGYYTVNDFILGAGYVNNLENGETDFTHYSLGTGADQWNMVTSSSHSPSHAWYFGDAASGQYTNNVKAALETTEIAIPEDANLIFWHKMNAEISSSTTGYCYDGAIVEIYSGGSWQQITPDGGYNYLQRSGGSSPFAADTPMYSGQFDWTMAIFPLADFSGEVKFRFVFGSDSGVTREGWYLDDITVGAGLSYLPVPLSLQASALEDGSVQLNWTAPATAPLSYNVYRRTQMNQPYTLHGNSTTTSYHDTVASDGSVTYYVVTSVYEEGESRYSNPTQVATDAKQVLILNSGWNLVSLYYHPESMATADVFSPVFESLVQVKNMTQVYAPNNPPQLNTLTQLSDGFGYFVNMNQNANLTVEGEIVNPANVPLMLSSGWNLIGYTPHIASNIGVAFNSILNRIQQVKNLTQVYNPSYPDYLNTLNMLYPGKGYWIKLSQPTVFTYPSGTTLARAETKDEERDYLWQPVYYPNSGVYYAQVSFDGLSLQPEDYVGAFVGEECRGIAEAVFADGESYITLVVNAEQEENVTFKLCKAATEQVYPATREWLCRPGNTDTNVENLAFTSTAAGDITEAKTSLNGIYPNPFNPKTTISFSLAKDEKVSLIVYNIKGQKVKQMFNGILPAGMHRIIWEGDTENGKKAASGVYFLRFEAEGKTNVKKMLMLK